MNDQTTSTFPNPNDRKPTLRMESVTDQLKSLATTLDKLDTDLVELQEDFHRRIEALRAILLGAVK